MGTAVPGRCRFIENADCQRSWKVGSGLSRGSCDVSGVVFAACIIPLAIVIVACTMTLARLQSWRPAAQAILPKLHRHAASEVYHRGLRRAVNH